MAALALISLHDQFFRRHPGLQASCQCRCHRPVHFSVHLSFLRVQLHIQAEFQQWLFSRARMSAYRAGQRALKLAKERLAEEAVAFQLIVFVGRGCV